MTFIQPNRQNFILNFVLFGLIGIVTLSVIWLIFLYNQTVSLAHGAEQMRETAKQIETQNSELKGEIFALYSPDAVQAFAANHGMILDRTPEYSSLNPEWVVASSR
jgi:cell division protein FtsL